MSNRFVINWLAAALALSSAGMALAQDSRPAEQAKFYVGGGIGRAGYDTDFERTKAVIRSTGATTFNVTADAKDTMWKAYLGYRVHPNFSVEGGYWNYGKAAFTADITAPAVTSMSRNYSVDGYGADAVFWWPVGATWSGLVKAGAIRTTTKASGSNPGAGLTPLPSESSSNFNSRWGIGLEYRFTPAAAARIEYESVRKVGDDAKFGTADLMLWTIGANYRF